MTAYNLNTDISNRMAADANSLNNLKYAARDNSPESIKAAAVQFEALMVNMMLKSMRDATPKEGMFDSEQSRTFVSMLDQQLSQQIASRGTGLADMLARQLQIKQSSVPTEQIDSLAPTQRSMPMATSSSLVSTSQSDSAPQHAREFVQRMGQHAEIASQDSGIPAHLMLGQAALETGWGKRQITGTDGTVSNNLFGIKAGPGWKGKTVDTLTTEYINGVPQKRIEKFRAYDSYADSFRDFANMMRNNPRYENVMSNTRSVAGYAQAMQAAGYATDPQYASKLQRVISSITTT